MMPLRREACIALFVLILFMYSYSQDAADPVQSVNARYKSPLSLECTVVPPGSSVAWVFNNTESINVNNAKKYTIFNENNTLLIHEIDPSVVAPYECCSNADQSIKQRFAIKVYPYAMPADKPRNVVQGDPIELECKAWGVPPPTIAWYRSGTRLTSEGSQGRIQFKMSKSTIFPVMENATLRIEGTDFMDADNYTCIVSSSMDDTHTEANSTIAVQVKDKYAALWPFLGICVEVAVLCTVIMLFERRQAKKIEQQQSRESEEGEHLNAKYGNKSDDVRQRK